MDLKGLEIVGETVKDFAGTGKYSQPLVETVPKLEDGVDQADVVIIRVRGDLVAQAISSLIREGLMVGSVGNVDRSTPYLYPITQIDMDAPHRNAVQIVFCDMNVVNDHPNGNGNGNSAVAQASPAQAS